MGLLAQSFRRGATKGSAATIPIWQSGKAQISPVNYETYAREGYSKNEIVFACIEELATSAAEPRIVGRRRRPRLGNQEIVDHPMIALLNRPNPFLTRFQMWATVIMHLYLAGNAYVEKVRNNVGQVTELWIMRPDRLRVVPDRTKFIAGYEYRIGAETYSLPAEDVIHFKMRHPLDDFYGMPPMMAASGRIDIDNYTRDFIKAFFLNAGVPAGLLSIKQPMSEAQKKDIRGRYRQEFGGPKGWHDLLILDAAEASFTPMTAQLGQRGLVIPELDEIVEARTAMVFGVPLTLIGARLGMASSSYANRKSDKEMFWDETLAPLYRMLAETLDTFLVPDFSDIDEVIFDLSDVHALLEDRDKLHKRIREDVAGSIITIEEGRTKIGEPELPSEGTMILPSNMVAMPVQMLGKPMPEVQPSQNGNGKVPVGA